ncbi:hypothetical protein [Streptomyces sp. NPDC046727]|uniref:hypothetical protein n=1 Tax=Streptomyces sp. NPDC046727 TaxID=3155373 RepID=UPI0033F84831
MPTSGASPARFDKKESPADAGVRQDRHQAPRGHGPATGRRALHTDGALTKENLAQEAQVSHATVHRADDILAEWNAKVARPVLRTPGEVTRDETIAQLRKQLREARAEITQLNGTLDALATVTANIYHENQALKKRDNDRRLAPHPASD